MPSVSQSLARLRAGACRVRITPPIGHRLAGYPQRPQVSTLIHDDIYARALLLEQDGELFGLVSLEVMAVEADWVAELRRRAEAELGLPREHLIVAATHVHSAQGELFRFEGPLGSALAALFADSEGPFDPVGYEQLLRHGLMSLTLARDALRPARLRVGVREAPGIASNRVDPARPVDHRLVLVAVEDDADAPIATLVHFACHPTVLGDGDRGISGDFPGAACRILELEVGGVALFLNGALGDVSTRFSRVGHGYPELRRFGRLLGGAALTAHATAVPVPPHLAARTAAIELPPKGMRWVADAAARRDRLAGELHRAESDGTPHGRQRQLKTALQGARIALELGPRLAALQSIPAEVQWLQLAPGLELFAFPAELFSGLAARASAARPGRTLLCVGPANGYLGYIPTEDVFDLGGYEADTCGVERGAGEALIEFALARVLSES